MTKRQVRNMTRNWTAEELKEVSDRLESLEPQDALRWVVDNFETREFALACSFAEIVALDMLINIKPDARVFYIDTGYLFQETKDVIESVKNKYGINIERYASKRTEADIAREYGPELWKRDPDKCCELNKVEPLKEALSGLKLWISGVRRYQSPTRANTPIVEWDRKYNLIKVNPLAKWTKKQIWDYITANKLPYNALLDRGYPSIGCFPCTRPVNPGDDPRSGRWAGFEKTECGLHK